MLRSDSVYHNFIISKDCEYVNSSQSPAPISYTQMLNSSQLVSNKGKFRSLCFRYGLFIARLLTLIAVQDASHVNYLV